LLSNEYKLRFESIPLHCLFVKVKHAKAVPVLNYVPCRKDICGNGSLAPRIHNLTLALDGSEWSASRLGRFTPGERFPGTHWVGG